MNYDKLILQTSIKRYFRDKIGFDIVQDKFIEYADKYSVKQKKIEKLWDKLNGYYVIVKDQYEINEKDEDAFINKAFKILD